MCKLNNRYHDTYGLTPHLCVDCEVIEVDHADWMCDTCLTNYNTGNDVDPWINHTPAETAEYIKRFKEREQFEALVEQARKDGADRPQIYTDGSTPMYTGYGGRVSVGGGDEDGATLSVYGSVYGLNSYIGINCNAADLRAIAAQCLAAAEEVEKATIKANAR